MPNKYYDWNLHHRLLQDAELLDQTLAFHDISDALNCPGGKQPFEIRCLEYIYNKWWNSLFSQCIKVTIDNLNSVGRQKLTIAFAIR